MPDHGTTGSCKLAAGMARISIVDQWLRSPASPPTHYRAIMVVAERWGEQRVLMRAYAESRDQTRPTIVLHGTEIAIGPAGVDPNGHWGLHVQPPADGRAQELKDQLELAARRMSGSKGNPPRLLDEESALERKVTNNWAPGSPRDVPEAPIPSASWDPSAAASHATYVAQASAVEIPQHQIATVVPAARAAERMAQGPIASDPGLSSAPPSNPGLRHTPVPVPTERRRRSTGVYNKGGRTALGYTSGAGAQSAVIRLGLRPAAASRLGRLVDRTVPADFQISNLEREVLNALGERDRLTARAVGELTGVADPVAWMEHLIDKLEQFGLDLVAPGDSAGSEPTYVLRR